MEEAAELGNYLPPCLPEHRQISFTSPKEQGYIEFLWDAFETNSHALVMEAIAAMLAADLDLPVPEPFLVTLESEFIAGVPHTNRDNK